MNTNTAPKFETTARLLEQWKAYAPTTAELKATRHLAIDHLSKLLVEQLLAD